MPGIAPHFGDGDVLACKTTAQFVTEPMSVVQAEGGKDAVFQCLYSGDAHYDWNVFGPGNESFVGHTPDYTSPKATLLIPASPQYNNSATQCIAILGDQFITSRNATLLIQGPLASVTNLTVTVNSSSCSQLTISWSAPFSLNLTTADPDIQYCVEVCNVTGGGSHHLDSVCGITDTQYTYTAPDPTGVYNFTVTPRSNVKGSLNGTTSQPVEFSYAPDPINEFDFLTNTDLNPLQLLFPSDAIATCREPQVYKLEVQLINNLASCFCSATKMNMSFSDPILDVDCVTCSIERHEQYFVTLLVDGLPSEQKIKGTHDVYKVASQLTAENTGIEIISKYLRNSNNAGFFAIIFSDSDTFYRFAFRNGSEPSTSLVVSGLGNDTYKLAVYDLNNNTYGILQPESLPAVLPKDVVVLEMAVNSSAVMNESKLSVMVTNKSGSICIKCSTPGLTGCVGVIHSAPLDSYNLTVLTARAGIEKCTSERFQGELSVAVFDEGQRGSPIYQARIVMQQPSRDYSKQIIIGISLALGLCLVLLGIILFFFGYCKHKKSGNRDLESSCQPNMMANSGSSLPDNPVRLVEYSKEPAK